MSEAQARRREVLIGRLVKAFGIKGELKFHPSPDFWDELMDSQTLAMARGSNAGGAGKSARKAISFSRYRPHGNSYVVIVDGITDRNAAEAVVGSDIFVDLDNLDVELPDEVLPFQVEGVLVKTVDGDIVGTVEGVMMSSAHDVYEVVSDDGKQFLIPAVDEFIDSLDEETGVLVIKPIPGLIDSGEADGNDED